MSLFYCNQIPLIGDLFFSAILFPDPFSSPPIIITQNGRGCNSSAVILVVVALREGRPLPYNQSENASSVLSKFFVKNN